MQVSVTGKQIDVGEALRSHAENRLVDVVKKYFDNPIEGSVVFSRSGKSKQVRADISVHVARGIQMQSHGETNDPYSAFDAANERVVKQLRRQKRRLQDHRRTAADNQESPEG
jgi:ribosomal subunit interface protein